MKWSTWARLDVDKQAAFAQAFELFDAGHNYTVIDTVQAILAADPSIDTQLQGLFLLGWCYRLENHDAMAEASFSRCAELAKANGKVSVQAKIAALQLEDSLHEAAQKEDTTSYLAVLDQAEDQLAVFRGKANIFDFEFVRLSVGAWLGWADSATKFAQLADQSDIPEQQVRALIQATRLYAANGQHRSAIATIDRAIAAAKNQYYQDGDAHDLRFVLEQAALTRSECGAKLSDYEFQRMLALLDEASNLSVSAFAETEDELAEWHASNLEDRGEYVLRAGRFEQGVQILQQATTAYSALGYHTAAAQMQFSIIYHAKQRQEVAVVHDSARRVLALLDCQCETCVSLRHQAHHALDWQPKDPPVVN